MNNYISQWFFQINSFTFNSNCVFSNLNLAIIFFNACKLYKLPFEY